jgi:hypothetical protein
MIQVQHQIYDDGVVAVALVTTSPTSTSASIAMRWLEPIPYRGRDGQLVATTNLMGGSTDWFVLPWTLGAAIGRTLLQQQAAGLPGFDSEGFAALVRLLIDLEELPDAMCY